MQTKISSKGNKYYVVRLDTINSKNVPRTAKIHLHTTNNDELKDWDEIRTTISFFSQSESSSDSFYRSNVILASAISTDDIQIINQNKFSLLREICRIRDRIIFKIRSNLSGEEGNILCGILFGKRDNISDKTTDAFAGAGISHLLAVSGLHLSIIVMLLNIFLTKLFVGKKKRSIICIILTAVLSVMLGFTPS
ncbi:MAG: ComEC/Rec2 family competence protein, partial [Oscillospiraceae bacterium]|nr:ComEC/Rec2 family competence protein [Oscillospiraceae bacterium]